MSFRLREQYDWVVLGDGAEGLLSACLAARLGLSVLVLPLLSRAHAHRTPRGDVLDPESNAVHGILPGSEGTSGLLGACLQRLGLTPKDWQGLSLGAAAPQLITPHFRLRSESDRNRSEWKRELGPELISELELFSQLDSLDSLSAEFWSAYPGSLDLSAKEKSSKKPVAPLPRSLEPSAKAIAARILKSKPSALSPAGKGWSHGYRELWLGIWNSTSMQERDTLDGLSCEELLHLNTLSAGATRVMGGMNAYRELLGRLALKLGVHWLPKNACRRLFVEEGRFVGVQAAHIGSMIKATAGAAAVPPSRIPEMIEFSGKHRAHDLRDAMEVSGWRFTVGMTLKREGIPPGVSPRMVWQETGAPPIEVEVADPLEYGLTEPQHGLLFIRTTLPYSEDSLKPEYLRLVAARMVRQIDEIFPFFEGQWVRILPDFRSNATDFAPPSSYLRRDQIPYNLLRFRGEGLGSRSGIDRLMLVSPESFPVLGEFGGTVAAIESVAWLAQASGLDGPFSSPLR